MRRGRRPRPTAEATGVPLRRTSATSVAAPARRSQHAAISCRLKPHFTTFQWPVCLLPSRRMIFLATRIPIAVVTVVFENPSFVANPRSVILGSCTNSLYTCFAAAGKSYIKLGSLLGNLGSPRADFGASLGRSWAEFGPTWGTLGALWAD